MKTMRRFFSLLLALTMVFAMAVTANAAGETDGTIKINDATNGATYEIYKVFDATTQGEGDAKSVAYVYTKTGDTDALYEALIDTDSPFTLTATSAANKYNVALKDGKTASDVSNFLKTNETNLGSAEREETAAGTTVTFSNLTYGYYYITKDTTEQPGPTVGVTSVAPTQTIKDKSTKPGPFTPDPNNPDPDDPDNPGGYKVLAGANGKAIAQSENTANYGDTVYFILQAQATNYDEGKKIIKYTAYDVLGEGFKDFSVTKVTVNKIETSNYTVDTSKSPATVTIPWADEDGNHMYDSTATIKIYCQAVVDEDAVIGENNSNTTNKAWFNWDYDNSTDGPNTPDPTDPTKPESGDEETSTVTTKVYAIAINKTDNKGYALKGANFEITKPQGTGESATTVKIPVTLVTAGDADNAVVYKYDATSTNYTVVSPASGKIIIKGLEGIQYTVNETVAPDGYNIITEGVVITATEFESSSTTMTLYFDNGVLVEEKTNNSTEKTITFDVDSAAINVINLTGTELPSTGGMGTTLFYIIGGVLVVAAVILMVTKKRMRYEA